MSTRYPVSFFGWHSSQSEYAGKVSEDTAIHTYLFQSMVVSSPEISQILMEISKVEMKHFHLLGCLIKKLGVLPVYLDPVDAHHPFWSGKYVSYEGDFGEMLLLDIQAIRDYEAIVHTIGDEQVQEVLKRIVLDEQLHLEIFERLYQSMDKNL